MNDIPQRNKLNPAFFDDCNYYIGLPGIGSVYANYTNNAFNYNDLFVKGHGLLDDTTLLFKPQDFLKNLNIINNVSQQMEFDWLSFGFKNKNNYFSFNITEKQDIQVTYNKNIFNYLINGVDSSINVNNVKLSPISVDLLYYREYAFSMSKIINKRNTFGFRIKALFGKANINVEKFDATFSASVDSGTVSLASQQKINISLPLRNIVTDENGYLRNFDIDEQKLKKKDFYMNKDNKGYALDIGFSHSINDYTEIHASLIDIGFIKWSANTYTFTLDKNLNYQFDDWENIKDSLIISENNIDISFDGLTDSLKGTYKIDSAVKDYTTWLPLKLYFGVEHTLLSNNKLTLGGLCRITFYQSNIYPALTFAAQYDLSPTIDLTGSYTYHNRANNIGLGVSATYGAMQFYLASDNIFAPLWKKKIRNTNVRFGFNLKFCGRKKKLDCTPIEIKQMKKYKRRNTKILRWGS